MRIKEENMMFLLVREIYKNEKQRIIFIELCFYCLITCLIMQCKLS